MDYPCDPMRLLEAFLNEPFDVLVIRVISFWSQTVYAADLVITISKAHLGNIPPSNIAESILRRLQENFGPRSYLLWVERAFEKQLGKPENLGEYRIYGDTCYQVWEPISKEP